MCSGNDEVKVVSRFPGRKLTSLWLRFRYRLSVVTHVRIQYGVFCCLVLTGSGRSHSDDLFSVEFGGVRVFSKGRLKELEKFINKVSKRGYKKFESKVADLRNALGDELFLDLKQQKIGVRFHSTTVDLMDESGRIIFRGNHKDIKTFLKWFRMTDTERVAALKGVHAVMKANVGRSYDSAKAVADD